MAMVRIHRDAIDAVIAHAWNFGKAERVSLCDMGASLLAAGCAILSSGMNDEQVRALLEQAFEFSAPVRRQTEERWKREGFDPFAEKES